MLIRNAADAMSAAPPIISISTAAPSIACGQLSASAVATPNPIIAKPHTRIAATTATPCRLTRDTHPEKIPPATAPAGIAANSSANAQPPSSGPPKLSCAICGNSARGIPKTIAMMSTRNDIISTGCPRR